MSQVTYEIIRKLFEIYPIILQIVLFLVLWNVFFRWEKGIWIVAGILAVMNICMGLWLEKPGVIRYTMSAVIVLGYCFCKYQKHLEKAVFILLLFYNFHALSYLIAVNFGNYIPQISYMHIDDTYEKCYGYTQGMKENDGYSGSSSAKGTDAGRQKKARQKELLEEYLEKRAQAKKQQLEMLNKKIAKMELERSRQTQSWNSERQMAKASNAYDANIMMEAELVKNITKGENNGNFK